MNIEKHKIMETLVGSNLYGTNTPISDMDYAGIFIPPKEYTFGLRDKKELDMSIVSKNESGKNTEDAIDRKFYELKRFMNLAFKNNPNITELLFIPDKFLVYDSDEYQLIKNSSHLFLSRNYIFDAFIGYANSQKHKMIIKKENFKSLLDAQRYFNNNEVEEYLIEFARNNKVKFMSENDKHFVIGDLQFQKHLLMRKVKKMIDERLGRVTNRSELILNHGYDTKFASHLIRLLYEGDELLSTGKIEFPLKKADEILAIKTGKYGLTEIMDLADYLENKMKDSKEKSYLPEVGDFEKVNALTMNLIESFYEDNK